MTLKSNLTALTGLAYLFFLLAWGVAQAIARRFGASQPTLSLLFFVGVYVALSGVAVPLYLARRFDLALHAPISRRRLALGSVPFVLAVIMGVFFSDALPRLAQNPPSFEGVVKYLLLFMPMALGISLQSFFLIPRAVEAMAGRQLWTGVVAVAVAALSVGMGFWVDQLFATADLALLQVMLGVFFGLGAVLTRSLYLTYAAYLVVMLFNTLSEGKYYGFPWDALIIGSLLSFAAVWYLVIRRKS